MTEDKWQPGRALKMKESEALSQPLDLRARLTSLWAEHLSGNDGAIVLGTADDGVLWGRFGRGQLAMSRDVTDVGALLRADTLIALRVLGEKTELRLWRGQGGILRYAVMQEVESDDRDTSGSRDDDHPLIGANARQDSVKQVPHAVTGVVFSILRGRAGQVHAPPIDWAGGQHYPKLHVRHYYQWVEAATRWRLEHTRWLGLQPEEF